MKLRLTGSDKMTETTEETATQQAIINACLAIGLEEPRANFATYGLWD